MADGNNLGKSILKGALWTVLMRSTVRLLGIVSVLILARLLVPDDFGLIAKVVLIAGFLDMCSQFGFENALIKKQDADVHDYNTVWTLSIIRGAIVGLLLISFSPLLVDFFQQPELLYVFWVSGLTNIIIGFTNVGVVDFRKEMNFHLDFKFNLYLKLSSFFTTLIIALIWQSYWALPLGVLVRSIASVIVGFHLSNYRPRLELSRWRELFNFSKWMFSYGILMAISLKVDTFILSRFASAKELGLYTVAFEVSSTPSTELAMPVARAALPGLSKLNDHPQQFRQMYVGILASILLIAIPASVGLSVLSVPITALLLGPQWSDAAIYIEILALFSMTRVFGATSVSALIAFGQVDILAKLSIVTMFIRLICLPIGYYFNQSVGLCYGLLSSGILTVVVQLIVQHNVGALEVPALLNRCWRICLASALMYLGLTCGIVEQINGFGLPLALTLSLHVVAGAIIFTCALLLSWIASGKPDGSEQQAMGLIKSIKITKYFLRNSN